MVKAGLASSGRTTVNQLRAPSYQLTLGVDTFNDDHTRPLLMLPDVQQVSPQTLILRSRTVLNSISQVVRDDNLGLLGGERGG